MMATATDESNTEIKELAKNIGQTLDATRNTNIELINTAKKTLLEEKEAILLRWIKYIDPLRVKENKLKELSHKITSKECYSDNLGKPIEYNALISGRLGPYFEQINRVTEKTNEKELNYEHKNIIIDKLYQKLLNVGHDKKILENINLLKMQYNAINILSENFTQYENINNITHNSNTNIPKNNKRKTVEEIGTDINNSLKNLQETRAKELEIIPLTLINTAIKFFHPIIGLTSIALGCYSLTSSLMLLPQVIALAISTPVAPLIALAAGVLFTAVASVVLIGCVYNDMKKSEHGGFESLEYKNFSQSAKNLFKGVLDFIKKGELTRTTPDLYKNLEAAKKILPQVEQATSISKDPSSIINSYKKEVTPQKPDLNKRDQYIELNTSHKLGKEF